MSELSTIELRIEEIAQLFETFDPLPFREKDLDKDAEEYIVSWARELPGDRSFELVIHAPAAELRSEHARQVEPAFRRYFGYRAERSNAISTNCFAWDGFHWQSASLFSQAAC